MDADPDYDARPRVLIVDDEHVIARTLALILNQNGFRALPISRPWAAVQIAEGLQPDVLLTDLYMPEMDGLQVAVQVRAVVPHCHVVLLTAQLHAGERVCALRARGFHIDFLQKPIPPPELVTHLRSALHRIGRLPRSASPAASAPDGEFDPPAG